MIKLHKDGVYLRNQTEILNEEQARGLNLPSREQSATGTISHGILKEHNQSGDMSALKLKFDSLTSHDLTFVGIIQTAKASGLDRFPIPYVLTNCHNSLCAVGGTLNEDDHVFGLSAAKKYGGIYVPPHVSVIHQYMREEMAGSGKMILGSDSHTRYGALGTMAIGEGGGELVKQILNQTYDIAYPDVVGVYLTGAPNPGVGPQDVAIAIITATFKTGFVKNKIMEFIGPGIASMSTDYRNGIDVMTTETSCLSSVWQTDDDTKEYLKQHGRGQEYKQLSPSDTAYYDSFIEVDLSKIRPMIALPFHPSNGFEIAELKANLHDILHQVEQESKTLFKDAPVQLDLRSKIKNGNLQVDQGIIAGCAGGTYSNIMEAAHILKGSSIGDDLFSLSVYPSSVPIMAYLTEKKAISELMATGAIIKTAFCGPCFGAGDTPSHGAFSIRHTTRNFPNREGSKPGKGQLASVALMDARSIAATAKMGGMLTAADQLDYTYECPEYQYDNRSYKSRVYNGFEKPTEGLPLTMGPSIKDWPEMPPLNEHMLLKVDAFIEDEVTTTDELIPSGETATFRSDPMGLAQFTLSRRVPEYVGDAQQTAAFEKARKQGDTPKEIADVLLKIKDIPGFEQVDFSKIDLSSTIYAVKPGDGSAREQAASCQRVLGGGANIVKEYATKRYRSNLINWGMIPFELVSPPDFACGNYIFVPNIKKHLDSDNPTITAYVLGEQVKIITLTIGTLTAEEKKIICSGSLINYNRN